MPSLHNLLVLLPLLVTIPVGHTYRCSGVKAKDVCRSRVGLTFTDGCNWKTCLKSGRVLTTLGACPRETDVRPENRERARVFCNEVRSNLTEKLKVRMPCLEDQWERVCEQRPRATFLAGCSMCRCNGPGNAACESVLDDECEEAPRFVTDREYNSKCAQELTRLLADSLVV